MLNRFYLVLYAGSPEIHSVPAARNEVEEDESGSSDDDDGEDSDGDKVNLMKKKRKRKDTETDTIQYEWKRCTLLYYMCMDKFM
jgi:hypothetical protein